MYATQCFAATAKLIAVALNAISWCVKYTALNAIFAIKEHAKRSNALMILEYANYVSIPSARTTLNSTKSSINLNSIKSDATRKGAKSCLL